MVRTRGIFFELQSNRDEGIFKIVMRVGTHYMDVSLSALSEEDAIRQLLTRLSTPTPTPTSTPALTAPVPELSKP